MLAARHDNEDDYPSTMWHVFQLAADINCKHLPARRSTQTGCQKSTVCFLSPPFHDCATYLEFMRILAQMYKISMSPLWLTLLFFQWKIYTHRHHHLVAPSPWISPALFRHPSLSSIASGRSSSLHPVSAWACVNTEEMGQTQNVE